jgi:hypothetical protein
LDGTSAAEKKKIQALNFFLQPLQKNFNGQNNVLSPSKMLWALISIFSYKIAFLELKKTILA